MCNVLLAVHSKATENVQVKISFVDAMKGHRGSRGVVPDILNLAIG